jgi:dTDP-D-glucose 4,6-dehydratase
VFQQLWFLSIPGKIDTTCYKQLSKQERTSRIWRWNEHKRLALCRRPLQGNRHGLNGGKVGQVYNIGGHNERTNIHIVKTVISYIHDNVDSSVGENLIKYVEDRKGHDRRYGIDPEKIKEELGWYPETKFEDGIIKTIKWYLENKVWMENVTSGDYKNYYSKMYK